MENITFFIETRDKDTLRRAILSSKTVTQGWEPTNCLAACHKRADTEVRQHIFMPDFVEFVDANGKVWFNMDGPWGEDTSVANLSLIKEGFRQKKNITGLIKTPEGSLILLAVAPIISSSANINEALLMGKRLDTSLLQELKKFSVLTNVYVVLYDHYEKTKTIVTPFVNQMGEPFHLSLAPTVKRELHQKEKEAKKQVMEEKDKGDIEVVLVKQQNFDGVFYWTGYSHMMIGGKRLLLSVMLPAQADILAIREAIQRIILVNFLVVLFASIIGYIVAKSLVAPLKRLVEVTRSIAKGDLDQRVPEESKDEIGELALSFNQMTESLRRYVQELQASLTQMGNIFESTHDLDKLLESVLAVVSGTLEFSSASVMFIDWTKGELYTKAAKNVPGELKLKLGEGIAGWAAQSGNPVFFREDRKGAFTLPSPLEPKAGCIASVPLMSGDRIIGVLNGYCEKQCCTERHFKALCQLAAQAAVAIDNILLQEKVQQMAITDELTGIYNRRHSLERCGIEIKRASRFSHPLSILMIDIDFFKNLNDTYGHLKGDLVLHQIAQTVKGCLREIDITGRYGGEEFLVILPETDTNGAKQVAEKIRSSIEANSFGEDGISPVVHLTVSIGVATYPEQGADSLALIKSADIAMYQGKEQGRNKVVVTSDT